MVIQSRYFILCVTSDGELKFWLSSFSDNISKSSEIIDVDRGCLLFNLYTIGQEED